MESTTYADKQHDIRVIRLYFLVMLGSLGTVSPFINLFMARRGMNGSQIGLIVAIGSVVSLFAAPYWTRVQLEHDKPLAMLSLTLLCSGLATIVFGFQKAFLGIAFFYCLRLLFNAAHLASADLLALFVIKGTGVGYGSIRFWGSLGWAVVVLLTGWLNQKTSIQTGFTFYFVLNALSVVILYQLRCRNVLAGSGAKTNLHTYFHGVTELFRQPLLASLGLMLILTGVGNLGVLNFETLYLETLGAPDFLIGLACMVGSVVEIPGMQVADKLVRRCGVVRMLVIALLMNAFFRGIVYLFPSVWMIIALRMAGGFSFSILTVGVVVAINGQLPTGGAGTALVIFTLTIPTLTNILFSPLVGAVYDHLGGGTLYAIAIAGYLVGAVYFGWRQKRLAAADMRL